MERQRDSSISSRRYPSRPIVGVGAVVIVDDRRIVLVRRSHEPLAGRWSLPGGALETGETLRAAVRREVLEETMLSVDVGPIVDVVDHIVSDQSGMTEYHFVIADYLCWPTHGTVRAGGDADRVVLVEPAEIDQYDLTEPAVAVVRRGLELYAALRRSP